MTPLERLEERVSAYLDGEVTAAEREEVERELASNLEARELLEGLRITRDLLASLGTVRAPRSFAIPAAAPAPSPTRLFRRLELATRGSAAVAALLFVVAIVNDPGITVPVDSPASFSTSSSPALGQESLQGPTTERALAAPEAVGARAMPTEPPSPRAQGQDSATNDEAPQPAGVPGAGAAAAPEEPSDAKGDAVPPSGEDGREAASAPAPAPLASPDQTQPGTIDRATTSDRIGGVAVGLGTVALLLGVLAILLAWARRRSAERTL